MAVAVAALASGIYWSVLRSQRLVPVNAESGGARSETSSELVLADLQFPDLQGKPTPLSTWRGQILVINFWATWCAPCREEMPSFVAAQHRFVDKKLLFVGIGIDSPEKMAAFAQELKINYPLLVGDGATLGLMRELGNQSGGLPFTIVVDRAGKIVDRFVGVVPAAVLDEKLRVLTAG
ncbi:MAG: TlpA disulfide reductase family protein [Burkholderiales bacterium]